MPSNLLLFLSNVSCRVGNVDGGGVSLVKVTFKTAKKELHVIWGVNGFHGFALWCLRKCFSIAVGVEMSSAGGDSVFRLGESRREHPVVGLNRLKII